MSEVEFWAATPREIHGRAEVWKSIEKRHDFRAGVICSTIANANRDPKARPQPFRPQDFMPGESKGKSGGHTKEEWIAWARSMAAR